MCLLWVKCNRQWNPEEMKMVEVKTRNNVLRCLDFLKNFNDTSPFSQANETPVCPGFQSHGKSPRLHVLLPACNGILGFTSGATPADLLAANKMSGIFNTRPPISDDKFPARAHPSHPRNFIGNSLLWRWNFMPCLVVC